MTAQYQPIHLRDAYDGSVRATYRCFNHLVIMLIDFICEKTSHCQKKILFQDEMTAAYSVAFDPLGTKIYAGLKHEIRYFF